VSVIQVCERCNRISWKELPEDYHCTSPGAGGEKQHPSIDPSVPPCPLKTVQLRDE